MATALAVVAGASQVPQAAAAPVGSSDGVAGSVYHAMQSGPFSEVTAGAALLAPTTWIVGLGARLDPGCGVRRVHPAGV